MKNVNGYTSKAQALRAMQTAGLEVNALLTKEGAQPKIEKNGIEVQVYTKDLHLAPHKMSGFNTCAQASAGCIEACLHTAGHPMYLPAKTKARIARTQAYYRTRKAFMAVLAFQIAAHEKRAEKLGMACGLRLNATSDIPWESVALEIDGQKYANLMAYFDGVSMYDYTKITKRMRKHVAGQLPSNYHLTFSKTESNDVDVKEVLALGGNVAAVLSLDVYKQAMQQGTLQGWPVTDGDKHDYRPIDPQNCIVILKAKGLAKKDTSGFSIREFAA